MAEFSKQYCDNNQDLEMSPDFDITEISESLEKGSYLPMICEGYGFIAICKDSDGEIFLAIPSGGLSEDGDTLVDWKPLTEIIQ
jgi:hypothetical protein